MKTMTFAALPAKVLVALAMIAAVTAPVRADSKPASEDNKVTPDGEPIICRKVAETGSLVKKTKKCYTQAQWDRISEAARGKATRLQSDHTSGVASN